MVKQNKKDVLELPRHVEKKQKKKAIRIVVVFAVLIVIAIFVFCFSSIAFSSEDISYKIYKYGLPSLFIISLIVDMIPQVISAVFTLSVAIIAGINVYLAISTAILGSMIGSVIGFSVGKKYMFDAVNILAKDKAVNRLTRWINKYGKIVIPIAALSPLPYLPVVIGSMNFSRRNFIIYGLIPRSIGFVIYGFLVYFLQTL